MADNGDEIGWDFVMWPLKLMRFNGFRDMATDADEIGRDVVM